MSFYGAPTPPPTQTPGGPKEAKPTLSGVRIKQRKGAAKATAKFDPEGEKERDHHISRVEQQEIFGSSVVLITCLATQLRLADTFMTYT